jgi:hypothetical protein
MQPRGIPRSSHAWAVPGRAVRTCHRIAWEPVIWNRCQAESGRDDGSCTCLSVAQEGRRGVRVSTASCGRMGCPPLRPPLPCLLCLPPCAGACACVCVCVWVCVCVCACARVRTRDHAALTTGMRNTQWQLCWRWDMDVKLMRPALRIRSRNSHDKGICRPHIILHVSMPMGMGFLSRPHEPLACTPCLPPLCGCPHLRHCPSSHVCI